jgi:hypothetical protein
MKNDSLEGAANPPNPDIIAREITEDLEAVPIPFPTSSIASLKYT